MRAFFALIAIVLSLWVLESARSDVRIARIAVGETPVLSYSLPGADGPVAVVAHGFAGSSQMMEGYTVPLAKAGYRVYAFDFLGHGRHPEPMSGDVTSVDGTTRLLVEQTEAVIDAVSDDREAVALLGHSMATDVLVRVVEKRDDIGPVVLVSAFSRIIDGATPERLLLLVGAWEPGLRDFALDALSMVDEQAEAGETVNDGVVTRRAVVLPFVEHVSILQSRLGREEAIAWLDLAYGRSSDIRTWPTGPALVGLLVGLVILLAWSARFLPARDVPGADLSGRQLAALTLLPLLLTPPLTVFLDPGLMPVLVADYLALHLAIYGGLQLAMLLWWKVPFGEVSFPSLAALLAGCALFAFALDRYAANYWPVADRLWIIGAMSLGALPFFVADATLAHRASLARRFLIHTAFLGSLIVAVVLDFEGLFFLLMIAPVIVLFYLVFGTMGHAVSTRSGPLAAGIALGLILAWSLGVSFPLFVS